MHPYQVDIQLNNYACLFSSDHTDPILKPGVKSRFTPTAGVSEWVERSEWREQVSTQLNPDCRTRNTWHWPTERGPGAALVTRLPQLRHRYCDENIILQALDLMLNRCSNKLSLNLNLDACLQHLHQYGWFRNPVHSKILYMVPCSSCL